MVTGIGTVSQPTTAGVITSTTMANANSTVIQGGTPAGTVENSMPTRRASDNRRSNKPIMEKRRRARINNCLNELKTLILDAMKKDPARHSKLEKADILEMTVKHLENLQRQQIAMSAAADPTVINKFRAGFSECASEVGRFPGLEPTVKRRLLQHLANCLQVGANTIITNNNNTTMNNNNNTTSSNGSGTIKETPILAAPQQTPSVQLHILPAGQQTNTTTATTGVIVSNNQEQQVIHHNGIFFTNGNGTGVQLVPTRLANGDIALVLPTNITTTTGASQPVAQNTYRQQYSPTTNMSRNHKTPSPTHSISPLPMLIPIPARTSSSTNTSPAHQMSPHNLMTTSPVTSSPSSSTSSMSSPNHSYSLPNSPPMSHQHIVYEQMDTSSAQSVITSTYQSQPMPKPLSLVIRKTPPQEEEKPWRPW